MFHRGLSKSYLSLFFTALLLALPSKAFSQGACGVPADAEIFLMLDFTGSSSEIEVTAEKDAVRNLLDYYETASTKPRMALGRFNTSASVEVELTTEYSLIRQQLDILPKAGSGSTRIATGLSAARDHLVSNGTSFKPKYIMLFSDGQTGGVTDTKKMAALIKSEGTYIFAIHYPVPKDPTREAPGADLMKFIASSPEIDFYRSVTDDLSAAVQALSHNIVCEDGNPCTSNICDLSTATCKSSEPDSDGDGVLDCSDICPNQDDKVVDKATLKDKDGDGAIDCQDSCPTDFNKVSPGLCGCGAADEDANQDGYIDCLGCAPVDTTAMKVSMKKGLTEQRKSIRKMALKISKSEDRKSVKLAKKSLKASEALFKEATKLAKALPNSEIKCASRYCTTSQTHRPALDRLRQISTLLQQHVNYLNSISVKAKVKIPKKLIAKTYTVVNSANLMVRQFPPGPPQCMQR
ncbi:MAG: VWA domain-containing protein [Deltaproteobacteria bacterium]|nr:VWA domain-containing protein [Deltaproteobacteria bacterium]